MFEIYFQYIYIYIEKEPKKIKIGRYRKNIIKKEMKEKKRKKREEKIYENVPPGEQVKMPPRKIKIAWNITARIFVNKVCILFKCHIVCRRIRNS